MKKILSTIFALLLLFNITGCNANNKTNTSSQETVQLNIANISSKTETVNSNSESHTENQPIETENKEPLDLTGLWTQKDANPDAYMVATIKEDGIIGVFFMFADDDDTAWTYWVGTCEAPQTADEPYQWTSVNTYGGNGWLASDADDKEFSYSNGTISFQMTIEGETKHIDLIRGEWDINMIPENAFTAVKVSQSDLQKPVVENSGWILNNNEYLYYYIDLYNPNEDIAIEFPTIRVTARDANNSLIDTKDQTLSIIYPQQHFVYAGLGFSVDEIPMSVNFEVLDPEDYGLHKVNENNQFTPFEVVNATMRSDKVVGEIVNPNNSDFDNAIVVALMKNADGEVVAVASTFVDKVKAGTNTPFSISVYGVKGVASVECYANQW